ncbi:MAG TPA: hypothetical protein VN924_14685 [Bryobacteraceae bacterium]|nr:hypothetical protein [Bryobacteraceae bacterium]
MTASFRTVEICPEGKWTAQLDNKAWIKDRTQNLILYFSEVGTGQKYWFSVFWPNGYSADDKGLSFKDDVQPGDVLGTDHHENEERQPPA